MTPTERIDITDLGLTKVLAALCNHTRPLGMGMMNGKALQRITEEDCQEVLDEYDTGEARIRFDYLFGRPIKVVFMKEKGRLYVDRTRIYDRDSFKPAADVISELRK